jgi:hypothetical protein
VVRRWLLLLVVLAACSSDHASNPNDPAATPAPTATTSPPSTSANGTTDPAGSTGSTASTGATASTGSSTTTTSPLVVTGAAIAGVAGAVETVTAPPFEQTDPFSEAVRLEDGTCVGWADSRGGSTVGLAVGAPVVLLDSERNEEIGTGEITASRWEDMAAGGEQWNCRFEFRATVTAPHAEFRVRVASLAPWLARPDPTAPGTFVASVSTDASIASIPECPAVPGDDDGTATTTTLARATTTSAAPTTTKAPVTGWDAIGRFWSTGVRALCAAGLPVTAIARPCRPPDAGSEYITAVVASDDPTERYANGAAIPAGTELTVVVPVGRACE